VALRGVKAQADNGQNLRGHHGSALSHIQSGVKNFFRDSAFPARAARSQHADLLVSTVRRYGEPRGHLQPPRLSSNTSENFPAMGYATSMGKPLICIQMLGTIPMKLGTFPGLRAAGFQSEIPAAFSTLDEARNSLDYHWNNCIKSFHETKDGSSPQDLPKIADLPAQLLEYLERFRTMEFGF